MFIYIYTAEFTLTDTFADTLAGIFDCSNFTENSFDVTSDNEFFRVDSIRVKLGEYGSLFTDDSIVLSFYSEYDIGFDNKELHNNGKGHMIVTVVIFKTPQTSDGHRFDMLVDITVTDEYWSTKPKYSITGYHDLEG